MSEAIEAWEEKCNRLKRHGNKFELPEIFKSIALGKMAIGKAKDMLEIWESEGFDFEEKLKKEGICQEAEVGQGCEERAGGDGPGAGESRWRRLRIRVFRIRV